MSKRISLSNMTIPEALRALADEYDALWTEYEGSYSGSYKGAYNPEVQYSLYDRVHLLIGNLVYLAKVKNVGEAGFIVGIPPNEPDSLYWEVITVNFLIRGEQGLQGVKGEQGDKGLPGTSFYVSSQVGLTELSTLIERNSITYAGREVRNGDIIVSTYGLPFTVIDYNFSSEYHKVAYVENASFRGPQGERGIQGEQGGGFYRATMYAGNGANFISPIPKKELFPNSNVMVGDTVVFMSGETGRVSSVEATYINLIPLTDMNLKGPQGEPGQDSVAQAYKHQIQFGTQGESGEDIIIYIDILNRSSEPFSIPDLLEYLVAHGHTSVSSLLSCNGFQYITVTEQKSIVGVYSTGSKLHFYKPDKTTVDISVTAMFVLYDTPVLI